MTAAPMKVLGFGLIVTNYYILSNIHACKEL